MSESNSEPVPQPANPERFKTLVVVLTVLTTVITAIVACLQADVNIRASTSNTASQVDAILAAGELHRVSLQAGYDINVMTGFLKDSQEANVLHLTAYAQQQAGDPLGGANSLQRAAVSQARADIAKKFSIFFNDARYTPKSAGGLPEMQTYISDSYAAANELVVKQNAASDAYNHWNRKGDSYTSVLTILAVAFFLFGLAQALSPRLRLLFAIFGLAIMASAGVWTFLILVS